MSSNTDPYPYVISSSSSLAGDVWKAFTWGTIEGTNGLQGGNYIQIDLTEVCDITSINIGLNNPITTSSFNSSIDGTTFTPFFWSSAYKSFVNLNFTSPLICRYVRFAASVVDSWWIALYVYIYKYEYR